MESLPKEILILIYQYFDPESYRNIIQVSKYFLEMGKDQRLSEPRTISGSFEKIYWKILRDISGRCLGFYCSSKIISDEPQLGKAIINIHNSPSDEEPLIPLRVSLKEFLLFSELDEEGYLRGRFTVERIYSRIINRCDRDVLEGTLSKGIINGRFVRCRCGSYSKEFLYGISVAKGLSLTINNIDLIYDKKGELYMSNVTEGPMPDKIEAGYLSSQSIPTKYFRDIILPLGLFDCRSPQDISRSFKYLLNRCISYLL